VQLRADVREETRQIVTFGQSISEARKRKNLTQRQLAARVTKENGQPTSPQYLNDFERDRRVPSSDRLIEQFAEVPRDLRDTEADDETVVEAWTAFRRTLRRGRG
jgi:transcriptional regulator with XRE-family HTH domain